MTLRRITVTLTTTRKVTLYHSVLCPRRSHECETRGTETEDTTLLYTPDHWKGLLRCANELITWNHRILQ